MTYGGIEISIGDRLTFIVGNRKAAGAVKGFFDGCPLVKYGMYPEYTVYHHEIVKVVRPQTLAAGSHA